MAQQNMGGTFLSNLVTRPEFLQYTAERIFEQSAFLQSGVITRNAALDARAGGTRVRVPFFDNIGGLTEEVITSEASCKEMLRAQRSSRQYCAGRIAACHKRGDEAMAQRWTQIMNNIIPKQKDTERELLDLLERTGKTMTTEAAKRSFRTVFSELRQKLVAAPAALAAQLNPQDPHHAQGVMENYIRSLFKETYEDHQPTA